MNKPDLIEKQNRLAELKENNVSLKSQISGFEVKNAIEDLPKVQELEKTLSENSIEIIKIENELNAQDEKPKGKDKMTNFIESQNAVTEFFDVLKKNSGKSEIKNAWNAKLAENGVTITDTTFQLPRKLVESINTALLNTNPVFKVFHVTNVGALLVSRSFDSLSIAYYITDYTFDDNDALVVNKAQFKEISLVSVPADPNAKFIQNALGDELTEERNKIIKSRNALKEIEDIKKKYEQT